MVSGRAERGHKNVNVLRAEAGLSKGEERHEQKRRADVENQVAPAVEDPQTSPRRRRRNGRDGLGSRKSGYVLHELERLVFLKLSGKSTSASRRAAASAIVDLMRAFSESRAKLKWAL